MYITGHLVIDQIISVDNLFDVLNRCAIISVLLV